MNLKQKLVETFFKSKLREASSASLEADANYRKLSGNPDKDLSGLTQERMLRIAYHLYETNPLAHRIIELTKDFIIGNGINYTAQDERVKEVLDEFWFDPVNHWDLKQHQKALELGLYGEQCYPVFVNEINGRVRLGYVDPLQIAEVITDENNAEEIRQIKLVGLAGLPGNLLKKISLDEDPQSPTYGYLSGTSFPLTPTLSPKGEGDKETGACFFFAINKVSNATRGRSDLLSLSDWLEAYDQLLFNRLDRAALINAFVWDITLEGMDAAQIQEWLRHNPPPKPGSIRAHNERVKWEAVSPDLKSNDAETEAKLLKNHILGGAGFPAHWFSEGGDVNRATAAEMGEPTIKRLAARQRYFKYMLEHIFQFVIDQAIIHKRLPKKIDTGFSVIMSELSLKDSVKFSAALKQFSDALAIAQDKGWISVDEAQGMFADFNAKL